MFSLGHTLGTLGTHGSSGHGPDNHDTWNV